MSSIRTWIDEHGIRRCDRTERTDKQPAFTAIVGAHHAAAVMFGPIIAAGQVEQAGEDHP